MPKTEIAEDTRLPQITRLKADYKTDLDFINFTLDYSGNTTVTHVEEPGISLFTDCFGIFGDTCPVCKRKIFARFKWEVLSERKVVI